MYIDQTFEKYRPLEEAKSHHYAFARRSYNDAPDGEDLIGKLIAGTRWSFFAGVLYGSTKVLTKPYCKTYLQMAYRLLSPVVPLAAMSYAFTATTYAATNIRKADDEVNYAIGALAVSTVIGYLKGIHMGVGSCIYTVPIAIFFKIDKMKNNPVITKRHISPIWQRKLDFTLAPEREGEWKKEMPPQ